MRESNGFYLYNIYTILSDYGKNASDRLSGQLIKTVTGEVDTAIAHIGIYGDIPHQNMISTVYDLLRVADTVTNPIYPGTLQSIASADTLKAKLLITAMLDLSLPHNSPAPNSNEDAGGIFTNYIQCMDNVVRNWTTIRTGGIGLPRLRNIHANILATNKDSVIIDPIYVKNHGTLAEYGQQKEAQKRKNYAFYEGYSRLNVDLAVRSSGSPSVPTASGLMFRISPNIQLYQANLADTFNMFDTAFISGGPSSRRIIIPSNDSLLLKFQTDGIWLKGDSANSSEKNYYCGMEAVRLKMQSGADSIGVPFASTNEKEVLGDVVGSIVGGERSLLKRLVLHYNDGGTIDTIPSRYDEILLHGEERWFEFDTNYVNGRFVKFTCRPEDTAVVELYPSGYGVHVVDKAHNETIINSLLGMVIAGKATTTEVVESKTNAGSLLFKNAVNRKVTIVIEGDEVGVTPIETNQLNRILKGTIEGKIVVEVPEGVEIYKGNSSPTTKVFPRTKTIEYLDWDVFNSMFHTGENNLYIKSIKGGKLDLKVYPENDLSKTEILTVYHIKTIDKNPIRWVKQSNVYNANVWKKTWFPTLIGDRNIPTILFELKLADVLPEPIIREHLTVSMHIQGGRNSTYPADIVSVDLLRNGVLKSGVQMEVLGNIVRFWNIDIGSILNDNDQINKNDNSRFVVDIVEQNFQSYKDSDLFSKKLWGVQNHYLFGKAYLKNDIPKCITKAAGDLTQPGMVVDEGGVVFIKIVPNGNTTVGDNAKFIYPKSAKWFFYSGHNYSVFTSGFDIGDNIFDLCNHYDKINWESFELIVINSCQAVSLNLIQGEIPTDIQPSNCFSANPGLQWVTASKGATTLGYGSCVVKNGSGTVLYNCGDGIGKGPTDCIGACGSNNVVGEMLINEFLNEISGITDNYVIARKWVEVNVAMNIPLVTQRNFYNAIGVGAKLINSGTQISIKVFGYDGVSVQEVWENILSNP